ncbi:MAG: hypothetical protein ACFFDN_33365 [Candidatus Hodarchaeota archaeon]
MGEDFLRKTKKAFRKRRSQAYHQLAQKTLFTNRSEILEHEFRGDIVNKKSEIKVGENIIGIRNRSHLELMYENQIIGRIEKKQCNELLQIASTTPEICDIFSFTITNYSAISQDVYVKLNH